MKNVSVVVLAAGIGTRMISSISKVMHNLSGKPIIRWVIDSVLSINPNIVVVVVNRANSNIIKKLLSDTNVKFVYQKEQLGSADAAMKAEKILKNKSDYILIVNGDTPLIDKIILNSLINKTIKTNSSLTLLSSILRNPYGYGRIIKKNGILKNIVEEVNATEKEKEINEINSGIYCFDKNVWNYLKNVKQNNIKKEYYLTDVIPILKKKKKKISLFVYNKYETIGINTRIDLLNAERELKIKKIYNLINSGVNIIDINNVYISNDAKIGKDTIIYPGVFIDIGVSIGEKCVIKGYSYLINSKIGYNNTIIYSYIEGSIIKNKVTVGPFAHIRHGTVLSENVKIGNFSEIKNSKVKEKSKINHLSYIGDSKIGKNVNIGAGTITCNYDGKKKNKTIIGQKSFIGSNVNLVAPIKIGENVFIAAGSTVTKNVPSNKFTISRPKQKIKQKK
ncbi:MAG: bifunctional UDP-N-acetylglucosamine diphosphorylase/glucosamine-1-phosphate N-acetyltransferase GlmU [Endomicrobium sp.]|jgi:bifunctional UDP-N-acetylglucosamine pyrophosphorylase/glucosamine-1-phosphate N-acetyltransferase|nr:bifunctional UDP-N-acetylglucosamine diphosphorylase/glucosamine-1-phosphate N-acetyltransferase GlmU [Endomicrobium sp.]